MLGPLGLTLSHNRGVAFGLAGGGGPGWSWSPSSPSPWSASSSPATPPGRGCGWRSAWSPAARSATSPTGCGSGAVTDFVDLPHWPNFNLADVAITAGVLVLALIYLRESRGRGE